MFQQQQLLNLLFCSMKHERDLSILPQKALSCLFFLLDFFKDMRT